MKLQFLYHSESRKDNGQHAFIYLACFAPYFYKVGEGNRNIRWNMQSRSKQVYSRSNTSDKYEVGSAEIKPAQEGLTFLR